MGGRLRSLSERFWKKVQKAGPDECWLWRGARQKLHGYGVMHREGARSRKAGAHRISFELHNGAIPDGLNVCHHCDNPPCVNPAHLFLGTHADNVADKVAKGRQRSACGAQHYRTKLTNENVIAIKSSAERSRALARHFNVSEQSICDIRHNRKWRHIEGAVQDAS